MSELNVINKAVDEIIENAGKYETTYLDTVPYIGHRKIIRETLKKLDTTAVIYFINNTSEESVIKELKDYYKEVKEFGIKYANGLKLVKNKTITFIEATELDIEKKIKNIDTSVPVTIINDCTLTSRAISIHKLKQSLGACRVINMVHNNRLSESEYIAINTKKVGYVYVDGNEEVNDKYIDGFIVNPSDDIKPLADESDNFRNVLVLAGLERFKKLASCYSSSGSIIQNKYVDANYLIVIGNMSDSPIYEALVECEDNCIGVKTIKSISDLEDGVDKGDKVFICHTSDVEEIVNSDTQFLVITLLNDTCKDGVLYNIISKAYDKDLVCDEDDYNFKYLFIYDKPEQVKKSMMPTYKAKSCEMVENPLRDDIEPFEITCTGLQSVDYPTFEDKSLLKNIVHTMCVDYLNVNKLKSLTSLVNKGLNYNVKPKTFLSDSLIITHLNYNFKTTSYVDYDVSEYRKLAEGYISNLMTKSILSEKNKFNKIEAPTLLNILEECVMFESNALMKDYDKQVWLKNIPNHMIQNFFDIMFVNDMENINTSIFTKIIGRAIELYSNNTKNVAPKRQVEEKKVWFPIVPKFERNKDKEINLEASYKPIIKFSEYEKIANGAFEYSKKLKPETEKQFMDYLKNKKIVNWWCKNGDLGEPNFSVATVDKNGRPICFYPDWIISIKKPELTFKDVYLIVDTKAGMTLDDSGGTAVKIKALQEWCKTATTNDKIFYCGIITYEGGFWKISKNNIDYNIDLDYSNFTDFDEWIDNLFRYPDKEIQR